MKYGLLIVNKTDNIGDDIQTFAQKRFLPKVDYYIDREMLDTFVPEFNKDEKVAVIMNAWYMYNKYNWPPSEFIYPLLISMHISENDYFGIGTKFLEGIGGEYMRKYSPVGARDKDTLNTLKNNKIDGYFSGCLTLTIKLDCEKKKNDIVYLVDLDSDSEALIRKKFPNEKFETLTHYVDYYKNEISFNNRIQKTEELLKKYNNAKCVITTRLHCALPCLAMETPVCLIYDKSTKDRIETFLDLLNYCTTEEVENNIWNYDINNPPQNKEDYLIYRKKLEETCRNFITQCETEDNKNNIFADFLNEYWLKRAKWQKNLLYNSEVKFRDDIHDLKKYINELLNDKKWFQKKIEMYEEELKKMGYDRDMEEKETYIKELIEGKEWLKGQVENYKKNVDEKESYIKELIEGKEWLEGQVENYKKNVEEKESYIKELEKDKETIHEYELEISRLKNENAKVNYKIEKLKNDIVIKKIIALKKYDI